MTERYKHSLLFLISVISTIFLWEMTLRLVCPQNLSGTWRVEGPGGNYLLNESSGTAKHQFGKRMVTYSFFPPHLRDTPLIGNRDKRILFVGDSFTFGWLLNFRDTYVGRIQSRVDEAYGRGNWQILNAAAAGWGTADYVAYVEDFGQEIRPSMIVVFLNFDDIGRSIQRNLFQPLDTISLDLMRVHENKERQRLKPIINMVPPSLYNYLLENSHLVQLIRLTLTTKYPRYRWHAPERVEPIQDHASSPKYAQQLGKALFLRLSQWCAQNHVKLLVITTGWVNFQRFPNVQEPTSAFMQIAPGFFEQIGLDYVDISTQVADEFGPRRSEYEIEEGDGHPNEKGAALIAPVAWSIIRRRIDLLEHEISLTRRVQKHLLASGTER